MYCLWLDAQPDKYLITSLVQSQARVSCPRSGDLPTPILLQHVSRGEKCPPGSTARHQHGHSYTSQLHAFPLAYSNGPEDARVKPIHHCGAAWAHQASLNASTSCSHMSAYCKTVTAPQSTLPRCPVAHHSQHPVC